MKALLGILLLVNAALLMWNMGQREFMHNEHAPATEFHPELMKLLPAEKSRSMAKVTINSSTTEVTSKSLDAPVEDIQVMQVPSTSDDASVNIYNTDDVTDSNSETEADVDVEEDVDTETEVVAGQCMFIGPYLTAIDRARAGRQLEDMKIDFSETGDSQGLPLGYRVYQGPFSTSEEVYRAKRRLEKQGVKDLYLMDEGSNLKFISLGFFSNEKSAGESIRQFSEQNVESKQRTEYATHYWLSIYDLTAIEKLREKNAMPIPPGVSKIIKVCSEAP